MRLGRHWLTRLEKAKGVSTLSVTAWTKVRLTKLPCIWDTQHVCHIKTTRICQKQPRLWLVKFRIYVLHLLTEQRSSTSPRLTASLFPVSVRSCKLESKTNIKFARHWGIWSLHDGRLNHIKLRSGKGAKSSSSDSTRTKTNRWSS